VADTQTGEPLAGVTIVVTSPSLQQSQSTLSDGTGSYKISRLPPGSYQIVYYYLESQAKRTGVEVSINKNTQIYQKIDTNAGGGEVIVVQGNPTIDTTSTTQGVTLNQDYIQNIPVPGRTFTSALGAAAGTQNDGVGVSFSGSASLENQYVVDGVNTTSLGGGNKGRAEERKRERDMRWRPGGSSGAALRYREILDQLADRETDRALLAATRWHSESPGDVLALIGLGEALEAAGYPGLAARAYGSIVDLHPSRAEMRRAAAARLLRLGKRALPLAVDVLEVAHAQRPDHPHGAHLLAIALSLTHRDREAIAILMTALAQPDFLNRASAAAELLRYDMSVIAASWLRRRPGATREVRRSLEGAGIMVPMEPSRVVVLSWENDATDLDLSVGRGEGVARAPDWASGFGPETLYLEGPLAATRPGDNLIEVRYDTQAMMGHALGQVQLISHDGAGRLRVETLPFALMREGQTIRM